MSFVCECGSDDFYTHGKEKIVWYIDGNGDIIDSGDYIDSNFVADMPIICSNCEKEYSSMPPKPAEEEWVAMRQKHYMAGNTNGCPICDSTDIEGGSMDVEGTNAYQSVSCIDCGAEWTDIYSMTSVEIDSYPTDHAPEGAVPPEVPDPNAAFKGGS